MNVEFCDMETVDSFWMVQQTDSKLSERILANSDTTCSKHDNRTSLRDLPNENTNIMSKSDETSLLNKPSEEANKISGIKRPQQTPASNKSNLVYVRRKTESEHHKNSSCNKVNHQPVIKLHEHDEKNQDQGQVNISQDSVKPNITLPTEKSKGLISIEQWEERYFRLQNFLKALDLSNQDDYCQMLRSLTSVGLSKVAVELEKRSIHLSMEEAKEVQRAKLVDTLHIFPQSASQNQSTK